MVQVQVNHQLWRKQVVNQREVVIFLYVKVWITIGKCDRVGLVYIRVQVRDARTRDTHVVSQTEVAACADIVL